MKHLILILLFFPTPCGAQSITISATEDTACLGSTVKFTAVALGVSSRHYQWQVNGAAVGADSAGYITDSLRNNDTVSCLLTTLTHSVVATSNYKVMTMDTMPYAGMIVGTASEVCVGASITLSATVGGGTWSSSGKYNTDGVKLDGGVDGIFTGQGSNTWEAAGDAQFDMVIYFVSNTCGSDSDTKSIFVKPLPDVYFEVKPPAVCVGDYTFAASHGFSIHSTYGYTSVSGGVITGVKEGTDKLYSSGTNACGSYTYQMSVYVLPAIGSLVMNSGDLSTICVNAVDTILFSSSVQYLTWKCTSGAVEIEPYGNSAILTGIEEGTTTITFRASNSLCLNKEAAISIKVNPTPAPYPATIELLKGSTTTLTDDMPNGIWSSSNETVAKIDPVTAVLSGVSEGIATIRHTTDAGCYSEDKVHVMTNVVDITLFPNPATNEFVLQQARALYSDYIVTNSVGEEVLSGALQKGYNVISIERLARGLYFVKTTGDKNKTIIKLIKE